VGFSVKKILLFVRDCVGWG